MKTSEQTDKILLVDDEQDKSAVRKNAARVTKFAFITMVPGVLAAYAVTSAVSFVVDNVKKVNKKSGLDV